ncbi:DedA family protein [Anthocerotibacter panamensis]|uniref:DedA family protein n=1 Tax=Anthocerotibacter panamensis TaxID=2857077 RepID=UPI001C404F74|nr:VTT domain-containing protein [Anthocerotibacter panamensis]
MDISELLQRIYDLEALLTWGGYFAITAVVFVETGLLVGFFLPGDSLLVTAGVLAAQGFFNIWLLLPLVIIAAIAGDSLGYWIGSKAGPAIFGREDSRFFSKKNLLATRRFYEKYGGKTIIIARFVPVVRTFAPVVAGAAGMEYRTFARYNVLGGLLWVLTTVLGGFLLGKVIPDLDKNLHIVIAVVIVVSLLPGVWELVKARREG